MNEKLPQHWIGCKEAQDVALCTWPPRSPDLSVCDFSLGYVKDSLCSTITYLPGYPETSNKNSNQLS